LTISGFYYLTGAAVLSLNLLSFLYAESLAQPLRGGSILYVVLFHYFIIEYLYHEHVHLYTFDFVAERVGFKLTWGCICFYPFFYPIGAWTLQVPSACQCRRRLLFIITLNG
jgi:hypothetical protein